MLYAVAFIFFSLLTSYQFFINVNAAGLFSQQLLYCQIIFSVNLLTISSYLNDPQSSISLISNTFDTLPPILNVQRTIFACQSGVTLFSPNYSNRFIISQQSVKARIFSISLYSSFSFSLFLLSFSDSYFSVISLYLTVTQPLICYLSASSIATHTDGPERFEQNFLFINCCSWLPPYPSIPPPQVILFHFDI